MSSTGTGSQRLTGDRRRQSYRVQNGNWEGSQPVTCREEVINVSCVFDYRVSPLSSLGLGVPRSRNDVEFVEVKGNLVRKNKEIVNVLVGDFIRHKMTIC